MSFLSSEANDECEVARSDSAPISGIPTRGCQTGKLDFSQREMQCK